MTETVIEAEQDEQETPEQDEQETPEPIDGDDDEQGDEDETPESEQRETPPMSEKELEAAFKKLEAESQRHTSRISQIMGDDATTLEVCPLCIPTMQGFYWPEQVPDAQRELVAVALGLHGDAAIQDDDEAEMCDRCNGMGETRTGSKVGGQTTRPCVKCKAKGFTLATDRAEYAALVGARQVSDSLAPHFVAVTPAVPAMPEFDAWTRPRGHEFYGMNPVYLTPEQRQRDWYGVS